MGRPKSIDRDALLDMAEDIVRTRGAAALTIDALARKAGITKGGVQYTFASKADLIAAISERWMAGYQALFADMIGTAPSVTDVARAHAQATFRDGAQADAKAAGVMTGLLQSPEFMAATRDWYREKMETLSDATPEGRRARLAFLATEGAFSLRGLGLMDIDDSTWTSICDDIGAILLNDEQDGRRDGIHPTAG